MLGKVIGRSILLNICLFTTRTNSGPGLCSSPDETCAAFVQVPCSYAPFVWCRYASPCDKTVFFRLYRVKRNCFSSAIMSTKSSLAFISSYLFCPLLLDRQRQMNWTTGGSIVEDDTISWSLLSSDLALFRRFQASHSSDFSVDITLCPLPCSA